MNRAMDARVRYSKILYDKNTGLSRGVGLIQLDDEQVTRNIIRRGLLTIDDRSVIVSRESGQNSKRSQNASRVSATI